MFKPLRSLIGNESVTLSYPPSKARYQRPIHKRTLEPVISSSMWKIFVSECSSMFPFSRNEKVTVVDKPQLKIIIIQNDKHWYLNRTLLDKAFKGTVVNHTLTSLHERSLEITLTVPLIKTHITTQKVFFGFAAIFIESYESKNLFIQVLVKPSSSQRNVIYS